MNDNVLAELNFTDSFPLVKLTGSYPWVSLIIMMRRFHFSSLISMIIFFSGHHGADPAPDYSREKYWAALPAKIDSADAIMAFFT